MPASANSRSVESAVGRGAKIYPADGEQVSAPSDVAGSYRTIGDQRRFEAVSPRFRSICPSCSSIKLILHRRLRTSAIPEL